MGWGENTVGESAPSEPAACFVGGRISERVEKKRGSHGPGFRVAGPSGGCGSVPQSIHVTGQPNGAHTHICPATAPPPLAQPRSPTVRANRTAPRIPHQPQFQPSCSPPPALPAIYPPPNPPRPSPNTCAPTRLRPCLASAIPRQPPSDLPRPEAFFIRATSFLPSPKLLCSSCRLLFDLDLLSP